MRTRLLVWALAMGRGPQRFLDSWWIAPMLRWTPRGLEPALARRLLGLSPHYFTSPRDRRTPGAYAEAECDRIAASRRLIFERLLQPFIAPDAVVVDYGCGPGFLASAVAPHVALLFGCDVSRGVLACARALNCAANIRYLEATDEGLGAIQDAGVDLVYSIAVAQHVTDDDLARMLSTWFTKLKAGGRLVCHVQLPAPRWRSEREWEADRSLAGRLKFRYGLHCFAREGEEIARLCQKAGFANVEVQPMAAFGPAGDGDDVWGQHVVVAEKAREVVRAPRAVGPVLC